MITSKSQKVKSLFDPKADIEVISKTMKHYDDAYFKCVNTTSKQEDYTIFRVKAESLKSQISNKIVKLKEEILNATKKWCEVTIKSVHAEYKKMNETILTKP